MLKLKHFIFFSLLFLPEIILGQYFGQNKVLYEQFEFDVYETPHFEIYNYLDNDSIKYFLGQQSERWYVRHFSIFHDTIYNNPIILYNDHTDFKQTTVISGQIGVGTGGVTESLRNRVIIPMLITNRETDHVLGHEMVHVFQYNLIKTDDSLGYQNLGNVPLWMIEGMAEFLSIGPKDNRTSMWMRDAAIHDDVPSIKDMTRFPYKYFPYRYGHAFWTYVTSIWGDNIVKPLLYNTLVYGTERAIERMFNITADSLSSMWQESTKSYYKPFLNDTLPTPGEKLFDITNSGEYNLSPVISPDGNYVTYISNRDVITMDILMADAKTGEIIKKLTSSVRKTHIDDFNYIESAGSWSPDGSKYVLSVFVKGSNKLLIVNVDQRKVKTIEEIKIKGIESFNNPRWSPDGESILFPGLVNGQTDLYLYHLKTKKAEKLTNDIYSDVNPSWSSDGSKIAFISERGEDSDLSKQVYGNYKICIFDTGKKTIEILDILPEADVYNPVFSPGDTTLYFLSDADGFRNLYEYNFNDSNIYRMSRISTGISGITDLAPSFSVARETGEIAFTVYNNDKYEIFKATPEDFIRELFTPDMHNEQVSYIPPGKNRFFNLVETHNKQYPQQPADSFRMEPYRSKFQLDYIGASGVGASTGYYGTYASGGIVLLFSDMLKHHQILTSINVNGEIYDIGGGISYLNLKSRANWGATYSHIPYRSSYIFFKTDSLYSESEDTYYDVFINNLQVIRIFEDKISVFGQYPLSSKLRFEGGLSYARYGFRIDSINYYYDAYGYPLGENKTNVDAPEEYYLGRAYLAFVGDNSQFGLTSPLKGYRFRIHLEKSFDEYDILTVLLDYRKYFRLKPFSIGLRALHYGRYADDTWRLYPLFLGYEYYIRGYTYSDFTKVFELNNSLDINNIIGDKMLIANFEIRLPFTGIKRLALIKSNYLYSDLVYFFDAGLAWDKGLPWHERSNVVISWYPELGKRTPVFSTGLSLRINLFGYAILEPYVAIPFQLEGLDYTFGFTITGGGW